MVRNKKYQIIGNMTGNSMDAIDLVFTEFDQNKMHDICSFSIPFDTRMQEKYEKLRSKLYDKNKTEISQLPEFIDWHDEYIRNVADCVNKMCEEFHLDKKQIDAIGFHGKTFDHNPPSRAKINHTLPYTLQVGSGKMLADLTNIPVVYDFRSDAIMENLEGAPLIPPHNAHIAQTEGDGIYYNGGNTSNFAVISNGVATLGADAGPFNEFIDNFIRQNSDKSYDTNGEIGKNGKLNPEILKKLYEIGKLYYEAPLPKSGDPAYYHKEEIFDFVKATKAPFSDIIHTFEYFASYIALQALTLVPEQIKLPPQIVLFGGGWKNPVVTDSFQKILAGNGYILPQHKNSFNKLINRLGDKPDVKYSKFGEFMEARLFADMAYYTLTKRSWPCPEFVANHKNILCGISVLPNEGRLQKFLSGSRLVYNDYVSRASRGWQNELITKINSNSKQYH